VRVSNALTISLGATSGNKAFAGSHTVNWDLANTSIENVIGGAGNDIIVGTTDVNNLQGGLGNDWLDGGAGNDVLRGGAGDDTYVVDSATDSITELLGEGNDKVRSTVSYSLTSYVERLDLLGTGDINGTG
jgi:Ca2+-binding RTX toxin-like protein